MDSAERRKKKVIRNLELLGVFTSKNDPESLNLHEFSWDTPNYKALPIILHRCFENIDDKKCVDEFEACWPLVTAKARLQFRRLAMAWVDKIKKTCQSLKLDSLSLFYDNPIGERYVKFLYKFTNFAVQMGISNLREEFSDDDSVDDDGSNFSPTNVPWKIKQFVSRSKDLSKRAEENDADSLSGSEETESDVKRLELVTKLLQMERDELNERRNEAYRQLAEDKEMEKHYRELALNEFKELAKRYFSPLEIEEGVTLANYKKFKEKVTKCWRREVFEFTSDERDVDELAEKLNECDLACSEQKPVLKGLDSPGQKEVYKGLCRPDGRVDVLKLVQSLRSSIRDIMEIVENNFENQMGAVGGVSANSGEVTKRVIERELQRENDLMADKERIKASIDTMKAKIEAIHRVRPLPPPTPGFAEVFNMKVFPKKD